jgi:hypothetical protein
VEHRQVDEEESPFASPRKAETVPEENHKSDASLTQVGVDTILDQLLACAPGEEIEGKLKERPLFETADAGPPKKLLNFNRRRIKATKEETPKIRTLFLLHEDCWLPALRKTTDGGPDETFVLKHEEGGKREDAKKKLLQIVEIGRKNTQDARGYPQMDKALQPFLDLLVEEGVMVQVGKTTEREKDVHAQTLYWWDYLRFHVDYLVFGNCSCFLVEQLSAFERVYLDLGNVGRITEIAKQQQNHIANLKNHIEHLRETQEGLQKQLQSEKKVDWGNENDKLRKQTMIKLKMLTQQVETFSEESNKQQLESKKLKQQVKTMKAALEELQLEKEAVEAKAAQLEQSIKAKTEQERIAQQVELTSITVPHAKRQGFFWGCLSKKK